MLARFLRLFGRKKAAFEQQAEDLCRQRIGESEVKHGQGFDLFQFKGDLATYKAIQTLGNKAKLDWRSVQPENINWLCDELTKRGVKLERILCHGTRNGSEQAFFKQARPAADVLGTEISDTATRFPMTIEWDFHEVKPEWIGVHDLVFSNSWDHTYDPNKLFPAWVSCVKPGGALVLEWSAKHAETKADAIDPFRADRDALCLIVGQYAGKPPQVAEFRDKSYIIARK